MLLWEQKDWALSGLRERKKRQREQTILDAAEKLFRESGYERTTMAQIAEAADVSTVTVFNYYKTKGELLLALISNENAVLLDKLRRLSHSKRKGFDSLILDFFRIVVEESMRQVDKSLWRHVISTSIVNPSSDFGDAYKRLQREILDLLVETVAPHFAGVGKIPTPSKTVTAFCDVLYPLHYMEFCNFVAEDSASVGSYLRALEKKIEFVTRAISNT